MEIVILGCLSACLVGFMIMASVSLIGVEKKIEEAVHLVEKKVKELYAEE